MALLAADLAGGIISNATCPPVPFRKQSLRARQLLFLHGLIYPLIIIGALTHTLGILMLVGCHKNMFTRGPRPDSYLR